MVGNPHPQVTQEEISIEDSEMIRRGAWSESGMRTGYCSLLLPAELLAAGYSLLIAS
jgi:hypothetical protein